MRNAPQYDEVQHNITFNCEVLQCETKVKKKKKKVQEQETRVKLVYLLVLNVIFHP